ncbi:MAG: SUMF1/EgtB/PvdO family nonheme iron enzyme [Planctomycetes bacterium]|nr:SUMF1/EgtB/PvdO family nonheme iron enzyme [Planctomycetota bacterium]
MAMRLFSKLSGKDTRPAAPDPRVLPKRAEFQPSAPMKPAGDELAQAIQARRFGYILANAERFAASARYAAARAEATKSVDAEFALVPDGFATVSMTVNGDGNGVEQDVETAAFLLAGHPVTNAEYQLFVDSGGYENFEFWPEEVCAHIVDFKDRSGRLGPRFWQDGRHDKRVADHPVVGVSHVEALVYARWAGYRLPTEAEWQMAASWRLRSEANVSRRYPWGDALDLENCNIWHSGHGGTLPVSACPGGNAPNGVAQLIGNVWEWTSSDFTCNDLDGRPIVGDTLMKTIRGGAFDTYFPWQATASFRSASPCLTRAHNIGFRCALDALE